MLNLFYEEPMYDRWIRYDRYPREVIRRIIRGKAKLGGQQMVFVNLCKGLDQLGIPYRVNAYRHCKNNPNEIACIVGKPHVLLDRNWQNPILFGASIFSHPSYCPDLFEKYDIRKLLVPGKWIKDMFIEGGYSKDKVLEWPVGIETDKWIPSKQEKKYDFLIYQKIRWLHDTRIPSHINYLEDILTKKGLTYKKIVYGFYKPEELFSLASEAKAAIFVCEHETQGLAYQQLLSMDIPMLAWRGAAYWEDPSLYPDHVQFRPVTAVPYWDERCGEIFDDPQQDFEATLELFLNKFDNYNPRAYILENLTLKKCAQKYLDIYHQIV